MMMMDYRHEVERRYFIMIGEVPSEAMVEKMISERKSVVVSLASMHEIRDRDDVAKVVERSLLELHQVFLDMAIIVEEQVDKMDDIEHQVISAAHYIKGWIQGTEFSKDIPKERPEMVSHHHHSPPCVNHASCYPCCNQPKKSLFLMSIYAAGFFVFYCYFFPTYFSALCKELKDLLSL
ncbi:Syntaxin-related protein KNOLLE [Platanthera zijinensis]|uniref:Syntaxin-related protein KNOLLE n=1 Tax=Platanthera zijinensis TaxID=2320716 RepID=A0AAP0BS89_9ASPA